MRRILALAGSATLLAVVVAANPSRSIRDPLKAQVMVHCPNGGKPGFVTPQPIKVAVGDTIEWRMTGQVTSDTLVISLKNPEQTWPFTGAVPKGRSSAQTGAATTKGTFGYNVQLECRVQGGGTQSVTIDPDIIIE